MTATEELRRLLDNHRRNSPTYDCMTCSHATVNDWESRNVTCDLTGTSGRCTGGWCMSYKPRVPHDVVRLARRKVSDHE